MKPHKNGLLYWCDSIEKQFKPREIVPRGENPTMISEEFLATAIKYIRALCKDDEDGR